jgi:hypothetical protein
MANKQHRDWAEMKNLFSDPKFSRQAWKSVGVAIAMQPAVKPIKTFDKDGNETFNSQVETYSYNKLAKDIKSLQCEEREPTELEMILHCQMVKARTDTSAAVFIRDTLGAKPVDETKVDAQLSNPYEQLTDEELEVLQAMREKKALEAANSEAQEPSASLPLAEPGNDETHVD